MNFQNLYAALFKNAHRHVEIIRTLANKNQGMNRNEIVQRSSLTSGTSLTSTLEELEQSGFISAYFPFGKKKTGKIYRLTDEYSLFYLQFIERRINEKQDIWKHLSQTQAYRSWSGYAFESVCLKHLPQIKKALGISGVYALASTFYKKGTPSEAGTHIDLVLDRNDQVINLFEIKFYNEIFSIGRTDVQNLREKMSIFRMGTKTRKQLFWTLISTFGIKANAHSLEIVDSDLDMNILFESA